MGRYKYRTPEYTAWESMKSRCNYSGNIRYKNYGGRGISVCERWNNSFQNFLADMGKKPSPEHSIDRIDSNGNYESSNCRWATRIEQQNNRPDNRMITFNGETLTQIQWSRKLGLSRSILGFRLRSGWSVEKALTTPTAKRTWKQSNH